jgi:Fe(3+) dicitrate transport protein
MSLKVNLKLTVMAGAIGLMATSASAQQAAEPADGDLPEVEVIQKKAPPAAKKKAPAAKKAASPAPQPPPQDFDAVDDVPAGPGGTRGADGRVIGNAPSISPVDPSQGVLPTDLQNYTGAGTRVTPEQIEERRPKDNHELLARVPGVTVVNDDGMSRHIGIGMRGSPVRRARKVLVMEDGVPINFSTYLDPSTHYTPPTERVESVEVLRGTVVSHGPLTNHGVVNFRNLNPFGTPETVITAALGYTEDVNKDLNNYRHVHTRQNTGNVGVVASYSGGESGGAWDNEVLRYNDFYGALAWRGFSQDLTVSGGYFRQRDTYDEFNFPGSEADFYRYGRRKVNRPGTGFATGDDSNHTSGAQTSLNQYNADYYHIQAAHNWYIAPNATLSTRVYHHEMERNRPHSRNGGPFTPGGSMRSRDREYEFYGADSRIEVAKLPLVAGVTFDFQGGVRFERHTFHNCNTSGVVGEKLTAGNEGRCAPRNLYGLANDTQLFTHEADSFAAFIQTPIHLTRNLTVTPGVRFENYDITSEHVFDSDGFVGTRGKSDHDHVLGAIGFAWEALPRSTIYGGFHQGITPQVVRDIEDLSTFPLPEEEGDNYQIGLRTTAVRGLTLDFAYFHSQIDNYQIKSPLSSPVFSNSQYGIVDEVEINGFEIYSRLDSQPFTGGSFNIFGEATYTFADSEIKKGVDERDDGTVDVSGNKVPEVPRHFATLTLGVEQKGLWDASVTGTYIGEFFTDARNTGAWTCVDEDGVPLDCADGDSAGVIGKVDGQWLLSARANYHVPNTGLTLFVSGQNLTDEFYVSDFSDGAKPGVGRTLWAGFTYKFD